jgi:hypothetical protein
VKDKQIQYLENQQKEFANERQGYIEKLMNFTRKMGQLESKLLHMLGGVKTQTQVNVEDVNVEQFHI